MCDIRYKREVLVGRKASARISDAFVSAQRMYNVFESALARNNPMSQCSAFCTQANLSTNEDPE